MSKRVLGSIIIDSYIKASASFDEVMAVPKTPISRDAAIQRFEYTFELSWKMMKRVLEFRGRRATSPREVFRIAAQEELIADPTVWFDFLEKRNLTVHTYNEEIAESVYAVLPAF